ncbi:MAG TPA: phosphoribosylglycinamide formyltransferase [Candidatus Ornithomonoglobus intestinigallinarum]|uniref:Phosphoribosylglycinamide formyltransferase n=1 Tax=Candidatus Ornithomonoglobus intestinigallinarum TaxID=2840894 RepID=A0A9D1H3H6_9FIRM|nr:phosphoribosylglycinamide formyltransferase [Candidatus Ornithomonoglobus intestinigallinarum]
MKNIGVLISGGGTNLQALIDAQKSGVLKSGRIVCVCSNSASAYGITRAENEGIPTKIIRKNADCGGDTDEFSRRICDYMKEMNVDIIVLAGFLAIFGGKLLEEYADKIINIHPSLIPSFCGKGMYGLKVHEAALAYGVKVTGATTHLVNEVVDGGKIIMQKAVYTEDGDTPEILQRRVMEQAEWKILPESVELLCSGKIK